MSGFVRSFPLLLVSLIALLPTREIHAQSVATNPVGYNMFTLYSGDNLRANTFVQPTAFQSTMSSFIASSTSTVTVSASGSSLTSGSFAETGSEPSYYMEVLSGSSTGLILDILANSASTVTVNANLTGLVSGTESICIRPHTTLNSLFPPATSGLQANTDYILLYAPNSSTPVIFDLLNSGWENVSSSPNVAAGNQVIYPGQGFIIYVATGKTVPVVGCVKPGPTLVPLYPNGVNLVGNMNPVLSGTQTLASFNFPGSLTPNLDYIEPFNDNGLLQSAGVYYVATTGTNLTSNGNSVVVNASNAVVVGGMTQAENWIMPSFYTSGD